LEASVVDDTSVVIVDNLSLIVRYIGSNCVATHILATGVRGRLTLVSAGVEVRNCKVVAFLDDWSLFSNARVVKPTQSLGRIGSSWNFICKIISVRLASTEVNSLGLACVGADTAARFCFSRLLSIDFVICVKITTDDVCLKSTTALESSCALAISYLEVVKEVEICVDTLRVIASRWG